MSVLFFMLLLLVAMKNVESLSCGLQGRCSFDSFLLGVDLAQNQVECLQKCQNESLCYWFSFGELDKKCELFIDCFSVMEEGTLWISGIIGKYHRNNALP